MTAIAKYAIVVYDRARVYERSPSHENVWSNVPARSNNDALIHLCGDRDCRIRVDECNTSKAGVCEQASYSEASFVLADAQSNLDVDVLSPPFKNMIESSQHGAAEKSLASS